MSEQNPAGSHAGLTEDAMLEALARMTAAVGNPDAAEAEVHIDSFAGTEVPEVLTPPVVDIAPIPELDLDVRLMENIEVELSADAKRKFRSAVLRAGIRTGADAAATTLATASIPAAVLTWGDLTAVLSAAGLALAFALVVGVVSGVVAALKWVAKGVPQTYVEAAQAQSRAATVTAEVAAVKSGTLYTVDPGSGPATHGR